MGKILLQILILLWSYLKLDASAKPFFYFRNINEKDGLSSNIVNTIAQDIDGFIWFGTDIGLNRINGNKVTRNKVGNCDFGFRELIVQSFVEIAIWHGNHQKPLDKKLSSRSEISSDGSILWIACEDDGMVGEKMKQLKSRSSKKSKFCGMQTTVKRVLFLDNRYRLDIQEFIDPIGISGTKVFIKYYLQG